MLLQMALFSSLCLSAPLYICLLLIHSSVDGHLGCFHVLAFVDRAACIFLIILLSGCMPRSGTSRSYGNSVVFERPSILFSIVATLTWIPTSSAGEFPFLHTLSAAAAKSLQSCLTLCDPIDGSPPGSPIPGILQARTLEWVAISFSNG